MANLMEKAAAFAGVMKFLETEAATQLKQQIEAEERKDAVRINGLDIWLHPRLAQLFARWLDSPDLIEAIDEAAAPYL